MRPDDVTGTQGRNEYAIDGEAEAFAVDRPRDEPSVPDAIVPERRQKGRRFGVSKKMKGPPTAFGMTLLSASAHCANPSNHCHPERSEGP
jgi:hypothetical protein